MRRIQVVGLGTGGRRRPAVCLHAVRARVSTSTPSFLAHLPIVDIALIHNSLKPSIFGFISASRGGLGCFTRYCAEIAEVNHQAISVACHARHFPATYPESRVGSPGL